MNDFLTVVATWGIWIAGAILFGVLSILFWGWQTQRHSKSALLAGFLSSLVGFIICSMFSTMTFDEIQLFWMLIGGLAIVLVWSVVYAIRKRLWRWTNLWIPAVATCSFCVVLLLACHLVRAQFPYQYSTINLTNAQATVVTPTESRGTIVIALNLNSDSFKDIIRKQVRPLVDLGYQVYFTQVDSGQNGLKLCKEFLQYVVAQSPESLTLLMEDMAGKQLFIATAENTSLKGANIIIYNIPESWPIETLSPLNFADKITGNITIVKEAPTQLQSLQEKMSVKQTEFLVKDRAEYQIYLKNYLKN